jgi:hypothetical protein
MTRCIELLGARHASTQDAADHFLILSPIGEAHSRRAGFSADEMTAQQKVELDSSLFGEEDPAPSNSTGGFAPGIVSASQCAHFTGK